MQDFETEEQQLDALKRWWKENSSSILIGLAIGGFSLGGWNFYQKSQYQHSVEASDLYVSVVAQAEIMDVTNTDKLKAEYSDTPYAALSAMIMAKREIAAGNMDKAAPYLQWATSNAVDDEISSVAQLRLARLMLAQKKYDEVNSLLSAEHLPAFDALYNEVKGDMHVVQGEIEQARIAYDKAIAGSVNTNRWLQLKRQDLGSSELKKVGLGESAR